MPTEPGSGQIKAKSIIRVSHMSGKGPSSLTFHRWFPKCINRELDQVKKPGLEPMLFGDVVMSLNILQCGG